MKILPLINPFLQPYEKWSTRTLTPEEMLDIHRRTGQFELHINDRLLATVTNPFEAATHMAKVGVDNGLESHIDEALSNSQEYSLWRSSMPSRTPSEIAKYQKEYPYCNFENASAEINSIGATLSPGQILFHGGVWPGGQRFVAERPLSTSLCSQVALRNAEHRGKAYDAGRIDLFVLYIAEPATNIFVYRRNGTNLGHEKEVLFAKGVELELCNQILIRNDYKVCKANGINLLEKRVPIYVLEVNVR